MATKQIPAQTTTLALGDSGTGEVTTKVIQFTFSTLVGSIVIQGRLSGSGRTFQPIPYKRRYLNGAVSDDQSGSAAITADSIIAVDAAGLEIQAVFTYASGAGPGAVDWVDLNG